MKQVPTNNSHPTPIAHPPATAPTIPKVLPTATRITLFSPQQVPPIGAAVNHANPVQDTTPAVAGMHLEGVSETNQHTNKEKLRGHQPPQPITIGLGEGLLDGTRLATWELEHANHGKEQHRSVVVVGLKTDCGVHPEAAAVAERQNGHNISGNHVLCVPAAASLSPRNSVWTTKKGSDEMSGTTNNA